MRTYGVDDSYDTTAAVYDHLSEGDHVRCRVTDPLLFLEGSLMSCVRVTARKDR